MRKILEVKNLSAGYGKPLLRDISFSVCSGQVVGILGRNGCGKTTFLKGITGGVKRFSGEIQVCEKSMAGLSVKKQAEHISFLPQQTEVMAGITAEELLKMGRYPYDSFFRERENSSETVRKAAGLFGIDELLQKDCSKLSHGQKQLVLLTRLFVQDCPLMLLDEPGTALDYDNTHTMYITLRDLVREKDKAALMVLHDPEQALMYCDRILIIKDGCLLGDISTAEAEVENIEAALRQLYPKINLRRDPFTGSFRCYYQM